VKGRPFAFGERDSAIGWHLPRAALTEVGLGIRDFPQPMDLPASRVLSAVRTRKVDAGVVMADDLERLTNAGVRLRVLKELSCPSPFDSYPEA